MELKILCVGDVVGGVGRRVLREGLATLIPRHGIDFVIVNAENVAGGSGITPTIFEKIINYGADVVTLGDHVFRRREIIATLETSQKIVRPANLPTVAPGKGLVIGETRNNHRVAVVSLIGRVFMKSPADCPFAAAGRLLATLPDTVKIVVVDLHAEATSEKVAMGWYLDGKVTAVIGTHTHIPTADERILPGGTAYITDMGMTGPYDSVLGRCKEGVLRAMTTGVPAPFDVATDDARLCGVIITVDSTTGKALAVERITFTESTDA